MGYRSNVDMVFYTRQDINIATPVSYAALKLWVDENYPLKEAIDGWGATVTYEPERGYIYISYEDVKWYEDNKHVTAAHATMARFQDTFESEANFKNPAPVAYEFVRVGEELGDVDESRSEWADYRLGVLREVYFE